MDHVDLEQLLTAFATHWGGPRPTLLVRAPGRVNLIGEHIDYNGLPVLPMAIQRHVALLFRPRMDGLVRIASVDRRFAPREFSLSETIAASPGGDWANYVKAAAQALARHHGPLAGFDGVVGSTVPVAAGLSSSSALVIAVALTVLRVNELPVDPVGLAEEMARAERYTGTHGGGMDQAICLGGRAGTASRVDFHPLRLTAVPVPLGWRFLVAYSLAPAEKSGRAQAQYNERTRECAAALAAVTAHLGLHGLGYPELLAREPLDTLLTAAAGLADPMQRRFRHVVTEADRVAQAQRALLSGDLAAFGRLLSASHESLRTDYEVSAPALDELVGLARDGGAVGARLTGAGMGGCIVAACTAELVDRVRAHLTEGFYGARRLQDAAEEHLFVAEPSDGARVEEV